MEILLVLCNVPDQEGARRLARTLVERRLAACVNLLSPCESVYRWEGEVEEAREWPLLIKTTRTAYPVLERAIQELHPYQVPEIVAWTVGAGLPAYLSWVATEVEA